MLIESFSGVRGIYGESLTLEEVSRYAHAYVSSFVENFESPPQSLVIGRDSRVSGSEIVRSITDIWLRYGIDVIDVGILPTPLVEHAVRVNNADGGVIITASHNEPEFNGMKFLRHTGSVLYAAEMKRVIRASKNDYSSDVHTSLGTYMQRQAETVQAYIQFLESVIGNPDFSRLRVLVDPNGGAASVCIKQICRYFGLDVVGIGMDTGKFWRKVEPKKEHLLKIPQYIRDQEVAFAACFDCDADRVECVLSDGTILAGNIVLALLFEALLPNADEKYVVCNDASSGLVHEIAQKYGAEVMEVEVGEANVVQMMEKEKILYGGEGSSGGGIVFPSRCRDGIMATLIIARLIAESEKSLETIVKNLPKYTYIPEKLSGVNVMNLRSAFKDYAAKHDYHIQTTGDETGGMKLFFDDNHWAWIRGSKTEPNVVRLHFDGKDDEKLNQYIYRFKQFLCLE